jgi:hypothetical protein
MRRITVALIGCLLSAGFASRAADLNEIVERATAALKSDWAADPSYACLEKDEKEKDKKRTSKTFDDILLDGSDYHVPSAFNDQPLSADRRKAELQKLANELKRREGETDAARRARVEDWKKRRNEEGDLLLAFPDVLTFQLIGEEDKDGHPSYVLSATPKPGAVPATTGAKVLTGIKGKVWVEKETMHPIHIECTVVKPVPIYGVLASVLPGTQIEIRMTQVTDAAWLIDLVSMKLELAKLHFFKSGENERFTYTDYLPNAAALEKLLAEAKPQ